MHLKRLKRLQERIHGDKMLEDAKKIRKIIEDTYRKTHIFNPPSNFLFYLFHPVQVVKFTMVGMKLAIIYNADIGIMHKKGDKHGKD